MFILAKNRELLLTSSAPVQVVVYGDVPMTILTSGINDISDIIYHATNPIYITSVSVINTSGVSVNAQFFVDDFPLSSNLTIPINGYCVYKCDTVIVYNNQGVIITDSGSGGSSLTNTDDLPEGSTNLYFTEARARGAISVTTTGSGIASYNSGTGEVNIPAQINGGYY